MAPGGWRKALFRVAPSPGISEHEQHLLAGLAVTVTLYSPVFGMGLLPHWINPSSPAHTGTFVCGVVGTLGGALVYGLNRHGRYRLACYLLLLVLFVAAGLSALDRPEHVVFLCVSILLATALLPRRAAAAFGLVALLAHALPLLQPGVGVLSILVPLAANSVVLSLAMILQGSNRRLEQQRLEALRRSEERSSHVARLEALGRLAGGVAHDFNNLLTVIGGGLELTLNDLEPESPLRQDLADVKLGTERAIALTRQLLAFSRRQVMQPRVVELNAVLSSAAPLIRRMLKENVQLDFQLGREAGRVLVDPVQLEQVLMNLCMNAADAMPLGGRLTLSTDAVQSERLKPGGDLPAGSYARLQVRDTGHGMDEQTLKRAFEPFFTTKEPGRGTGLGLATVHGIVEQSGGCVLAESKVAVGTTFTVLLPRTTRALEDSLPPPRAIQSPRGGTQTILLVEDEGAVRKLSARVLASLGYSVIEAASAEEALRLWPEHRQEIALLLTDVVMPGLTGPQLAAELRRACPTLPVVFVSGYADEVVARQGMQAEDGLFLEKPFTPAALGATLEAALKGGSGSAARSATGSR
jgi:signal transduction histidine kinase/ActR/RegA family two-component response regulator